MLTNLEVRTLEAICRAANAVCEIRDHLVGDAGRDGPGDDGDGEEYDRDWRRRDRRERRPFEAKEPRSNEQ